MLGDWSEGLSKTSVRDEWRLKIAQCCILELDKPICIPYNSAPTLHYCVERRFACWHVMLNGVGSQSTGLQSVQSGSFLPWWLHIRMPRRCSETLGEAKLWARQKFRRGKRGGQHHSGLCAMPLCACANAGYMWENRVHEFHVESCCSKDFCKVQPQNSPFCHFEYHKHNFQMPVPLISGSSTN